MIDAGSLGSAIRPVLLVGHRGVPPGDLNPCTFRSFMLPMSCNMLDILARPGVAINSGGGGCVCSVAMLWVKELGGPDGVDVVILGGWNDAQTHTGHTNMCTTSTVSRLPGDVQYRAHLLVVQEEEEEEEGEWKEHNLPHSLPLPGHSWRFEP